MVGLIALINVLINVDAAINPTLVTRSTCPQTCIAKYALLLLLPLYFIVGFIVVFARGNKEVFVWQVHSHYMWYPVMVVPSFATVNGASTP